MKRMGLLLGGLASLLLVVTGCAAAGHGGESGVIALAPFVDETYGLRGVRPAEGWAEKAALQQQSAPVSMDELAAVLVEDTDLVALPRSTGTYEGRYLTWDLYTFTTRIEEVGPGIYRVDMGLAQGDAGIYLVFLISEPASYPQHETLYETVFQHTMYAMEPLHTQPGGGGSDD